MKQSMKMINLKWTVFVPDQIYRTHYILLLRNNNIEVQGKIEPAKELKIAMER